MSYYDDSSLFVAPNGYKASVLFAQKPMDANGQLAFTRSNDTATRVASNGLIEKVRTNVVTYSQNFSDASWTKTALTISTSATANPVNGALTAQDAIPTATLSTHRFFKLAGVVSAANTWSIYAKAKGYNFITIVENGNTGANVSFNLSTGTIGQQNSAVGRIESLGNGWYRCSMIHTTLTTPRFDVYVSPTDSISAYTADGTSGVTLFGAQAEASDFGPTPYIPTTSAAVSVGPLANIPRIDYLGGGCGKLLLEPQRQNLVTFSEQFDNAAWIKFNATISANVATSPDGYTNADKLIANATLATHGADRTINITGVHTFSVFAKASESSVIALQVQQSSVTSNYALIYYDLISGQVESGDYSTSLSNGTIQEIGNGWYRCTITYTPITAGNHSVRFFLAKNIGGNKVDYVGNGTDGVFLYGAQLEAGSYASSYVNTLAASVTRGADAVTDSTFTALPNPNFTIFFEVGDWSGSDGNNYQFRFIPSSGARSIQFRNRTDGWRWLITNDAGVSAYLNVGSTTYKKMACRYDGTNYQLFANGSAVGTPFAASDSLILTNLDYFPIGIMGVKQMLCFPTALTNQELAALTTL